MATKKPWKLTEIPGDAKDQKGFPVLVATFVAWLRVRNHSESTVRNHAFALGGFAAFLLERGIGQPALVTRPMIERYQLHLFHLRRKDGKGLSFRTQTGFLQSIRSFFRWLSKNRYILANPASDLDLPRKEDRLPTTAFSVQEVEQVLAGIDLSTPVGIRDRAMLEVLYSTGIRRQELINLTVFDIDAGRGTVMIRQGKGKKDRMIPIGERALAWLEKYQTEVRPNFVVSPDEGILFLSVYGEKLGATTMTTLVRNYITKAGLDHSGACHLFRHTMATLMLENGADIRFLQEMLGHSNLKTTEVYTHVSIRALKEVHTRTHPGSQKVVGASCSWVPDVACEAPSVPDRP